MHDSSLKGKVIGTSQPRNLFPLIDANSYVFIAGGIGITPILPMIQAVDASGIPWRLIYGGRSRNSMAFSTQLRTWAQAELCPQDEMGLLDVDAIIQAVPADTAVYCCGPEGLISAVQAASELHRSTGTLHIERFSTSPAGQPASRTSFEVELRRSGHVLNVPQNRTILDVVRDALPTVPSSCEEGFCGACITNVVDGTPEHHDTVLTDEERESNTVMLICVGRAKSATLVLDL